MTNENCASRMISLFAIPAPPKTSISAAVTDVEILDAACAALHNTGYAQLRSVKLYCHHGRVVLQGRISTYYLKQFAQEVVGRVPNVKEIDNDLRVVCSR